MHYRSWQYYHVRYPFTTIIQLNTISHKKRKGKKPRKRKFLYKKRKRKNVEKKNKGRKESSLTPQGLLPSLLKLFAIEDSEEISKVLWRCLQTGTLYRQILYWKSTILNEIMNEVHVDLNIWALMGGVPTYPLLLLNSRFTCSPYAVHQHEEVLRLCWCSIGKPKSPINNRSQRTSWLTKMAPRYSTSIDDNATKIFFLQNQETKPELRQKKKLEVDLWSLTSLA